MKTNNFICLVAFLTLSFGLATAQVCLVDSQYNVPGVFPSDTLPDLHANMAYDEVVQFVFAPDTVMFGFTLPYDSIRLDSIIGLPAAVNWNCNVNNCKYDGNWVDPIRFCLRLTGTPVDTSLGMPGWDSIIVRMEMYANVPFGNGSFLQGIPLYYRRGQLVGISLEVQSASAPKVHPNPVTENAWATFTMEQPGMVLFSLTDAFGGEIGSISQEFWMAGTQKKRIQMKELPAGVYFLRIGKENGSTFVRRIIKL